MFKNSATKCQLATLQAGTANGSEKSKFTRYLNTLHFDATCRKIDPGVGGHLRMPPKVRHKMELIVLIVVQYEWNCQVFRHS